MDASQAIALSALAVLALTSNGGVLLLWRRSQPERTRRAAQDLLKYLKERTSEWESRVESFETRDAERRAAVLALVEQCQDTLAQVEVKRRKAQAADDRARRRENGPPGPPESFGTRAALVAHYRNTARARGIL